MSTTNSTSSWVPNNNESSAYVGAAPNTQRDWYIVRGLLRAVGQGDVDPAEGYILAPQDNGEPYVSKRPAVIAGIIIAMVAITIVTSVRLGLRVSMSQMRLGADDCATIAAASMGLTYLACQLIMAIKGGGDHIWQHTYEDLNTFTYYGTVDKLIFYVAVALVKVSLTLFIRRLADRISLKWRWFCDIFLFTLAAYILVAIFWFCFTCNPARAQWDKLYSGQLDSAATCIDPTVQGQALNIVHVLQGTILLSTPIVILWSHTMEWKKKMRLFMIWGVGLLVVLFGLLRMVRADFTSDLTWTYTNLLIWTSLDITVGIVVISLPVMDAWLAGGWRKAMTKMGRTSNSGGGAGKSGYGNLKGSGFGTTMKSAGGRSVARRKRVHGSSPGDTESTQGILTRDKKEVGGMELAIIRTDEYAVQYTHMDEDQETEGYGAHIRAEPSTDK